MRFKGDGSAYTDDLTWFSKELVAYNRDSGFLWGSYLSNNNLDPVFKDHKYNGGCVQKSGPWAWFELTFSGGIFYVWDTEWLVSST